ncbi:MAG: hypothetical protein ACTSVU_03415 [Promethearchaeota archaeon]
MDDKQLNIEELKLIQKIIDRMGSNSFKIKGWAITLIVGTLILKSSSETILIAFLPLIVFWILDAFYLQHEQKFRNLYRQIVEGNPPDGYIQLSLDTSKVDVDSLIKQMFSTTIGLLYGVICILILAYLLLDYLL